jgi:hypothetical protein
MLIFVFFPEFFLHSVAWNRSSAAWGLRASKPLSAGRFPGTPATFCALFGQSLGGGAKIVGERWTKYPRRMKYGIPQRRPQMTSKW